MSAAIAINPETLTGWESRIRNHLETKGEHRSKSAIQRLALKIHRRATSMQEVDPDVVVLTFLMHGRSITVDSAVGEAVARKLSNRKGDQ